MTKSPRNIELKARVTADDFIPFAAECEEDGISQSTAIRNMIRSRTAHRNGTDRRGAIEGPNRARSAPAYTHGVTFRMPSRPNYGAQVRMRV